MMNPVHAIGVFHDQNGSICASVAASETIMIARPIDGRQVHVTRTLNEQPRSAGVPDALAEDQHLVRAAEAARHQQRLQREALLECSTAACALQPPSRPSRK